MPPAPLPFDHFTVRAANGCLIWTGRKSPDGYGKFRVRGREHRAHRVAWEREHGPIPEGQLVLHTCDTPLCVEPKHLWLGSPADNSADMARKGRGRNGRVEGAPPTWRKLSNRQVAAIRVALNKGQPKRAIARRYGVSDTLIRKIGQGYR